ncbi:MAG: hypothetical protein OER04_11660 [Cyclobacteriaceae bacterium]|nr:hypothetical protein [Cyclobacteriaceae bacterium]
MKSYSLALRQHIKKLTAGLLAGAMVGTVVLGIGGRLIMRIIALIGGVTPGASLGGSLEVMAFGSLTGILAGAGYTLIRRILPGKAWLKGTLFGLLIYAVLLVIPFDSKLAAKGFLQLTVLIHLLFGGLCVVFGLVLIPSITKIYRRLR